METGADTIVALATPRGVSAIAVVRMSGPGCGALARMVFGLESLPVRLATRGDYRAVGGKVLDDVLWTYFEAPRSYTGEDGLEVSCHGNPIIAQLIIEDLVRRGLRPAEPGEFTRRAFLHGRMDLSQAEAVMDLIHARSERALAVAGQQLRGSLGRQMRELIDRLLEALARVEAYIDFPEEDLPPEDRESLRLTVMAVARSASRLRASQRFGDLLRDGVKTVILGEPNAGKSSLLNRLLGRDRALVSPEPGTTRDFLEEPIAVGPHWLRLIDTAGLSHTPGEIERLGIEKTLERAAEADLVLWVIDGSAPSPAPLPRVIASRLSARNAIVVANKLDLVRPAGAQGSSERIATLAPAMGRVHALVRSGWPEAVALPDVVAVSALTGEGVETLTAAIASLADALQPETGDELIAVNARHAHALDEVGESLGLALKKLDANSPTELLASDLRAALEACGVISGRVDNEQMLDRLFASFCIGK